MRAPLYLLLILFTFNSCDSQNSNDSENDSRLLGEGSELTESGLEYLFTSNGTGPEVSDGMEVMTHCILKVGDSTEVWTTRSTDETFNFLFNKDPMIPGFVEMVSMMREGDRVKVIIPPELGYGARGAGADIPPNAVLSFDIEIINVAEPRIQVSDVLFQKIVEDGYEAALTYFQETIKPDPDKYDYSERQLFLLASKLKQDGRINDFTSILELTAEEYPESTGAFYRLAVAYDDQGRKDEAKEACSKSLEIDPNNQAAQTLLESL